MGAPALLFIDVETSGLVDPHKPLDDPSQPWAVSIGAELTDLEGRTLSHIATQIRSEGRRIKPEATAVHGITNEMAGRGGVSETAALGVLVGMMNQVPFGGMVVGFNVEFDRQVLLGVLMRRRAEASIKAWTRPGLVWTDIQAPCLPFCRLPTPIDPDAYKRPSLDDAGETLLGMPRRVGFHGSYDDATRCRRVFFELVRRGAIVAPVIKEGAA